MPAMTSADLLRRVSAALVPPPKRWPDEWADQCRILPPGSPEPGPWRSSRTPYMRGIVRAAASAKYKRVVAVMASQMGKALALDTPIPTPTGWTTMGEVEPGDIIFDDAGRPCAVVGVSGVMHGHDCYRVEFCDGTEIVADAGHLWAVDRTNGRRKPRQPALLTTTAEMAADGVMAGNSARFTIQSAGPLRLPDADLPVSPYVLGLWLGDGNSRASAVTCGTEDLDETLEILAAEGCVTRVTPDKSCWRVALRPAGGVPLLTQIRRLGLYANKHVPPLYLRASAGQRMALLQGLMDSDGWAEKKSGYALFCVVNEVLAQGVLELVRSLGFVPKFRRKVTKSGYESFIIGFGAYRDRPVFRLARKAERLPDRNAPGARSYLADRRHIRAIEPAPSVPVKCLAVDARSHLFLAGDGMVATHNTEGLMNIAGQRLDDDPAPGIYVGPTRTFVETQIEPRFMSMVRSAVWSEEPGGVKRPSLAQKVSAAKSADLKTKKVISGVTVRFGWAGSPTELAAMSAAWGQIDELDRMKGSVAGEGDPVVLVAARGKNFPDFTLVVTSTPLMGNVETYVHPDTGIEHWQVADAEDIESRTWRLWQEGTRFEWAWPCPDCGEYFVPRLKHLKWPPDLPPPVAGRLARLCCPRCGSLIEDREKAAMNAAGLYIAPGQWVEDGEVHGDPPDAKIASFWASGLCSPWKPWEDQAEEYISAARGGDLDTLQGVVNTGFGELFRTIDGEARPWEAVAALREDYGFDEVPHRAPLITAGVDVQGDRLYFVVRAWAARHESWLVRHGALHGETANPDAGAWLALEQLLTRDFSGRHIMMMAVDTAYNPSDGSQYDHAVQAFARRHHDRVMATWGRDQLTKPISMSEIDVSVNGRVIKRGLKLWNVHTDYMKGFLSARLGWPKGEPGAFHLPADTTDEYCRQMTSERRVMSRSGKPSWLRVRRSNHYWDCEVMAYAAAYRMHVHAIPEEVPAAPEAPERATRRAAPQKPARRQWLDPAWRR